jgi:hypothetical protein
MTWFMAPVEKLVTVLVWHHKVQQNEIGGLDRMQSFKGARTKYYGCTGYSQASLDKVSDLVIMIDHQNGERVSRRQFHASPVA